MEAASARWTARVEGALIRLTRSDPEAGGQHRGLPLSTVAGVDGGIVRLSLPAAQARKAVETEERLARQAALDPKGVVAARRGQPAEDAPHGSRAHAHGSPKGQRQHGTSGPASSPPAAGPDRHRRPPRPVPGDRGPDSSRR